MYNFTFLKDKKKDKLTIFLTKIEKSQMPVNCLALWISFILCTFNLEGYDGLEKQKLFRVIDKKEIIKIALIALIKIS